jgi:hypothetical protein
MCGAAKRKKNSRGIRGLLAEKLLAILTLAATKKTGRIHQDAARV